MNTMMLLPAKKGTCIFCATVHKENYPHNYWSVFYQFRIHGLHGRDATHADCVAHLPQEIQDAYKQVLSEKGFEFNQPAGDVIVEPYEISDPFEEMVKKS